MDKELIKKIKNNPSYQKLLKTRTRYDWTMAIIMLVVYYTFILTIAFKPEILGESLSGGVMSVGIPVGIFIILFSFVMTGIYTRRANSEFDDLINDVKKSVKEDIN
jgi:uncharacterized membrane protein (DUF485 family)